MHLVDAFIQSDFLYTKVYILSVHVFPGIEPMTFVLLTQCSTTEPQEHRWFEKHPTQCLIKWSFQLNWLSAYLNAFFILFGALQYVKVSVRRHNSQK